MKTLRLIKFFPPKGTASRYWEENDFRRNDDLSLSDLTAEQQSIVSAAMAWATSQLPGGFFSLVSVELRKLPDAVTQWSEPNGEDEVRVPLAYSPAFEAEIVGSGELGSRSVTIFSVPGPETDALAQLWNQLAQ